MGFDLTPRCAKCGDELNVNDMRALPDGKGFVCTNCFEHGDARTSPFSVNKNKLREIEPKEEDDVIGRMDEDIFNHKEYVCNSCNYTFKRKSDDTNIICPYCGKRNVQQKVDVSADVLLD